MIHQKSLASAPPRLQRMLLQLQRYDLTIKYKPGKDMLLVDALSRCPAHGSEEIKLDMRVDYVAFNKAWIAKLKEATREDPITRDCISTDTAGMATPTKAHSQDGQGVLGLQR